MKYCSNCRRLSKDDDFCSHCGSAVYDDNTEYNIDCSQIPGHTHEKQTFSGSGSYGGNRDIPRRGTSSDPTVKKKGNGCITFIVLIIFVNVFVDLAFGSWELLFETLERLLEM